MTYEYISYESGEDGTARLILLRPAFNKKMKEELAHALWQRFNYADEDKALVITGSGKKMFSGGEDIDEIDPDWNHHSMRLYAEETLNLYHRIIRGILLVDKPIIGVLNGTVAGSALSILLTCDERFAIHCSNYAGNAGPRYYKLIPGFSSLGLVPDCGITETLPRFIGKLEADRWFEPFFEIATYQTNDSLFRDIAIGEYGDISKYKDAHTSRIDLKVHRYINGNLLKRSPAEYAALKQRRNRELVEALTRNGGVFDWERQAQASCLMSEYTRGKIREFQQRKLRKETKSNG